MELPTEIIWRQLEYLNDAKSIGTSMQVCKLWYDVSTAINQRAEDEMYDNLHKYTYILFTMDATTLNSGLLARLQFGNYGTFSPMHTRRALREEMTEYLQKGLNISYDISFIIDDNKLYVNIGHTLPLVVTITFAGAVYCKFCRIVEYTRCVSRGVVDENAFARLERRMNPGDIGVSIEVFAGIFRDFWEKYYSTCLAD